MYLVGEPSFQAVTDDSRESFFAPLGQAELCLEVLRETNNLDEILKRLRAEYICIVSALQQLGVDFRIILSHQELWDKVTLGFCQRILNCRFAAFPKEYFPSAIGYPRDFSTLLPNLLLINNKVAHVLRGKNDGWSIISSPFGEGGRILFANTSVIIPTRLTTGGESQPVRDRDLRPLFNNGLRIATIPPPLMIELNKTGLSARYFFNDHLDRIGCLLIDESGQDLHLVVDPLIQLAEWRGRQVHPVWRPFSTEESLERIRAVCEPLGIRVHIPKRIRVPYSLNLLQFPDRRVLMTGGDEDLTEVVGSIIGNGKVCITSEPIRYFPTWLYAGIRCLVTEAPTPVLKRL